MTNSTETRIVSGSTRPETVEKSSAAVRALQLAVLSVALAACSGGKQTVNDLECLDPTAEGCPAKTVVPLETPDDTNGSSGTNGEGGSAGESGEGKGGNGGVSGAAGETSQGGTAGMSGAAGENNGGNSGSSTEDAGVNDAGNNTGADAGTVDAGENQGGNSGASGSAGETGNGGTSGTAGETSQGGNGGTGGINSMGGTPGVSGAAGEGGTSGSGGSSGEAGQGGSAGEGPEFCSGIVVDCNNDGNCDPIKEDTWASETNCGDCGTVCESGQECSVGICIDENGNGGAGGSNGGDQDLPNHTMVIYDVFPGDAPYEHLVNKKAGELQATINYLNNLADETFECLAAGDCDNTRTFSQVNEAFNVTQSGGVVAICYSLSVPGSIVNISHLPDVQEDNTVTPPDNWMVGVLVDENEIELSTTGPNGEVIEFPFGGTGVRITLEPTDESAIACFATKNGLQAQWIH